MMHTNYVTFSCLKYYYVNTCAESGNMATFATATDALDMHGVKVIK